MKRRQGPGFAVAVLAEAEVGAVALADRGLVQGVVGDAVGFGPGWVRQFLVRRIWEEGEGGRGVVFFAAGGDAQEDDGEREEGDGAEGDGAEASELVMLGLAVFA